MQPKSNALGEQFSLKDFHYQVMWLRECEFHDEFADNYILLQEPISNRLLTTFNNTEAFLNSADRQQLLFFPSTTLYYTFTYKGKITKNVKKKTRKKYKTKEAKADFTVANIYICIFLSIFRKARLSFCRVLHIKLQFTKVIENYNLNYLYA